MKGIKRKIFHEGEGSKEGENSPFMEEDEVTEDILGGLVEIGEKESGGEEVEEEGSEGG